MPREDGGRLGEARTGAVAVQSNLTHVCADGAVNEAPPHNGSRYASMKRSRLFACALGLTSACGDQVCVAMYYPAVQVTVMDSLTGVRREKGASLLIQYTRHGHVRVDSLRGMRDSVPLSGGDVGLMQLTVKQDGYVPWTQSVFVQGTGYCQRPRLVGVLARLQRTG